MNNRIVLLLCVAALLASVSSCNFLSRNERIGQSIAAGRDYVVDPTKNYRDVDLGAVIGDPMGYKLVDVNFTATFHRMENSWMAYYTHFTQESYACFSVWSEVHDASTFAKDLPFLFIRKDNPGLDRVIAMAKYTPVLISGTVVYDFNDYPWIEVDFIKAIGRPAMTDRAMYHLVTAADAVKENRRDAALLHYGKVLEMEISPKTREYAEKEIARISKMESKPAETAAPVAPAENPIVRLQEQIDQLKKELEQKTVDAAESNTQCNELLKANESARQMLTSTLEQNAQLGKQVAEFQKQVDDLTKRVTAAETERDAAASTGAQNMAALEKKVTETETALAEITNASEEQKKQLAEQKTAMDAQAADLTASKGKLAEYEKQLEELRTAGADRETFAAAVKERDQKIGEFEQKLKYYESQVEQLKTDLEQAKATGAGKADVEKALQERDAKIAEVTARAADAEQKLAETSAQIEGLKDKAAKAEASQAEAEKNAAQQIETLKADVEDAKKGIEIQLDNNKKLEESFGAKIAELTARNDDLSKELEKAKAEAARGADNEALQEKIREYEKRIKALQDELEALQKENAGATR